MTENILNEIRVLLNQQDTKLDQVSHAFQICLGENFLNYDKPSIYAFLSMIDDSLSEALILNEKIANKFESI